MEMLPLWLRSWSIYWMLITALYWTYSLVSNLRAKTYRPNRNAHTHKKICLVMPAGRSQRDITVRHTHTHTHTHTRLPFCHPPLIAGRMPLRSFHVISGGWIEWKDIATWFLAFLHLSLYLTSVRHSLCISYCIVKPAAVSPWAMLRLAGDDVISSGELHSGACHWLTAQTVAECWDLTFIHV